MLILFHVLSALAGILFAFLLLIAPSRSRLHIAGTLIATTIASGTWLVMRSKAHIIQTCITGLIYLAVTLGCAIIGHRKLQALEKTER